MNPLNPKDRGEISGLGIGISRTSRTRDVPISLDQRSVSCEWYPRRFRGNLIFHEGPVRPEEYKFPFIRFSSQW